MTLDNHLLVTLIEECNEVAYHASKALRFGLDDVEEGSLDKRPEREKIREELNHVVAMGSLCKERGIIEGDLLDGKIIEKKKSRFWQFMEYSKQRGTYAPDNLRE